jgi:hypothetical protein
VIKKITFAVAYKLILWILSLVILFHLLVLVQIIPYTIVWGGNIHSYEQMLVFESLSILINLLIIFLVYTKVKNVHLQRKSKLVNAFLWFFAALFFLNTLGNLTAQSSIELIIATPITLLLAVLSWRMAVE